MRKEDGTYIRRNFIFGCPIRVYSGGLVSVLRSSFGPVGAAMNHDACVPFRFLDRCSCVAVGANLRCGTYSGKIIRKSGA